MTSADGAGPLVVVGLDGSASSVAALSWAAEYADATGGTVRAVLAWHYPAAGPAPAGPAPGVVTEEVRQSLQDNLDRAVAKVYSDRPAARLETRMSFGHPAQVLIDESQTADLLVVGQRGRGAFTGMLLGSVSIHCVTNAECPVIVVRGRSGQGE
jgi:nucleotide-binding universal stress UspA family protein